MGVLGEKGIDTVMISDEISDPLFTINSKLETKLHYKKLNIIRLQKNIIYSLLKRDSDLIEPLHYFLQDFDLIVCTDFIFPWLLKKNYIRGDVPMVYLASNNMDFKVRYLFQASIPSAVNFLKPSFFIKYFLSKKGISLLLSNFNHILATSKFVMNSIKNNYNLNLPQTYLSIGIDAPPPLYEIQNTCKSDTFYYFGWGSGIRGLQDVIEAFRLYRRQGGTAELKIDLQGQHGFEERYYIRKILHSEVSKYLNLNYVNYNIEKEILSSKAVLLPFRVPYGYSQPPLTVLEAMRLGRIVISTNIGSIPELITNNVDGFLVNPASPTDISKVLLRIDDETVNIIGCNAYMKLAEHYVWSKLVYDYISRFKEIVHESTRY